MSKMEGIINTNLSYVHLHRHWNEAHDLDVACSPRIFLVLCVAALGFVALVDWLCFEQPVEVCGLSLMGPVFLWEIRGEEIGSHK